MQLARPQVAALRLAGETGERFSRSETTTSKAICGWRGTRLVGATYGRWSCHRRQTRGHELQAVTDLLGWARPAPSRLGEGPASLARKARPEAAGLQIRRQLSRILPGLMATPRMGHGPAGELPRRIDHIATPGLAWRDRQRFSTPNSSSLFDRETSTPARGYRGEERPRVRPVLRDEPVVGIYSEHVNL